MPDMYPDAEQEAPDKPSPEMPEDKAPDEQGKDEGETVLVAKSALGGNCKVGETYPMKVVAIYDDEVELSRSTGEKEEEGEDQHAEANAKIDAMAKPEEP